MRVWLALPCGLAFNRLSTKALNNAATLSAGAITSSFPLKLKASPKKQPGQSLTCMSARSCHILSPGSLSPIRVKGQGRGG